MSIFGKKRVPPEEAKPRYVPFDALPWETIYHRGFGGDPQALHQSLLKALGEEGSLNVIIGFIGLAKAMSDSGLGPTHLRPPQWQRFHDMLEAMGLHVSSVSPRNPLPVLGTITDDDFEWTYADNGAIDLDLPNQAKLLRKLGLWWPEVADLPTGAIAQSELVPADAAALYSLVREWKPRRIIHSGAAATADFIQLAAERNGGITLTRIGMVPNASNEAFDGDHLLSVPLSVFAELEAGDMIVLRWSAVAKVGSDVNRFIMQVLPILKPGVRIGIEGIFLPYQGAKQITVDACLPFNDTMFLGAFLACNPRYRIRLSMWWFERRLKPLLKRTFPGLPNWGGNYCWIERTDVA